MKFKSEVKFKSVSLFLILCLCRSNRLTESVVPHNTVGQSTTYYIQPSSSNSCPTEPCFTLQQLANSTNKLKNSSIELIFLPGNHYLDLELSIININTVSMLSNITNSLSSDTVVINCDHSGKFKFERIHIVSVISLTFLECNESKAMGVHQFVIEDSSFIGGAALEFVQTSAMLVRSTFYRNSGKKSHYVTNLRSHSQVGGAIVATARSNITVMDSVFEENSAKLGGAIFTDFGSRITIKNTSFSENSIYDYMQGLYRSLDCKIGGGVLYGDSGVTITIHDSQFTNNTAQGHSCGGVVFIISNEVDPDNTAQGDVCDGVVFASWCAIVPLAVNSTLTIENSHFINNIAQTSGGAIYAQSYVNVTIINSYFKDIISQGEGGIICAYDNVTISIIKSQFINIIIRAWPSGGGGSIIYIARNVKITFTFCQFINNSAINSGGAILYTLSYVNVTIISSYFKGITSQGEGGVIYAYDNVTISIAKSQFIDNTIAHERKGAIGPDIGFIYITRSVKITFTFCRFINNSLLDRNYSGLSGIVYVKDRATVIMINCYFFNNIARAYKNNIIIGDSEVLITVTHSQFTNNCVSEIIRIEKNSHLKITHSEFTSNSDAKGTVAEDHSHIIISRSYFKNNCFVERLGNIYEGGGGAVYADGNVNVTLAHSYFEGCTNGALDDRNAYSIGGVVFANYAYLKISYCQLINNIAHLGGGALGFLNGYNLLIIGSKFTGNRASQGASIFIDGDSESLKGGSLVIHNSTFDYNLAKGDGGVLYLKDATVRVTETEFSNNRANGNGGIMFLTGFLTNLGLQKKTYMYSANCSFFTNSAGGSGGLFCVLSGNLHLSGNLCQNNRADYNGGVLSTTKSNINISESDIQHNYAMNDGGVIHSHQSNITLSKSSFDSNTALNDGGVLFMRQRSKSIISECKLENNYAMNDGGVVYADQSIVTLSSSSFDSNFADNDGGVLYMRQNVASITECSFDGNSATNNGGVVNAYQGSLCINDDSSFIHNMAYNDGGAIHAYQLSMTLTGNRYDYNKAWNRGGVWFIYQCQITVMQSIVSHSEAGSIGVMYAFQGNITMRNVSCLRNNASDKGVIHTDQVSNLSVKFSSFSQNYVKQAKGGAWYMKNTQTLFQEVSFSDNAANRGGALYSSCCNILFINAIFKQNEADHDGGAMYMKTTNLNSSDSLLVHNNRAKIGTIYLIQSTAYFNGQADILNNSGSFFILQSNVTFLGKISFINGSELTEPEFNMGVIEPYNNIRAEVQQGGALTTIKSSITFGGTCIITDNRADDGGAIHAIESMIYVNGEIAISGNKAISNGGGVYLYTSELHFERNGSLHLSNNVANENGGGIHAIGSTIRIYGSKSALKLDKSWIANILSYSLCFTNNHADKGGGLYLDENAKIYLYYTDNFRSSIHPFAFINNSANYGGGIYISDNHCGPIYNSRYITNRLSDLCFIQVSAHCSISCSELPNITVNRIFFLENNYALISGRSLFGEMLDQCKTPLSQSLKLPAMDNVNQTCHQLNDSVNTISFIRHISNIEISDIGTEPYRLCFCQGSQFNCSLQHDDIKVGKNKRFSIELVAVDGVNHPVNATIYSHLARTGGRLLQGQEYQNTSKVCTELIYNILFSPRDQEELILYPKKKCIRYDSFQSKRKLTIKFTACDSCPIGFEKRVNDDTSCECVCHSKIKQYIKNCNASTEMLERKGSVWISYLNTRDNFTSGYLIYPYCPLNYCLPPTSKVEINLNIPHGADVQCADGHSGVLCGTCQKNLSLSLGSSRCIPCRTHWPKMLAILLGISLAGIVLIIVLLMLNLTVAIGTLNGILFYANIVAANGSTYMPFSTPNFATIFVSWLNLEIGFDACLFEGMNPFWKTLLQLAFPTYVVFLVLLIIIICDYSTKFAWLLGKKNPVATLATLILLSYTKYLNTIIATFSYVVLKYPDGSHRKLWRPDANVEYLRGKHIILFIIATLILIVGIAYTSLLFSWQWLLYYQDKKFLKWTRYQKLCLFLEPYHAPYNLRHRYWTGLLLFARVLLYIISAVNITGDPQMPLMMTIILITSLFLVGRLWVDMFYKKRLLEVMDVIMYVNITALTSLTLWNIDDTSKNQTAVVYISVTVTLALTMTVIIFHMFHYTCLLSVVKSIALKFKSARHQVEDDIISNREYHQPLITHSVIDRELPKPAVDRASEEENKLPVSTRSDDTTTASDTACVQGLADQES